MKRNSSWPSIVNNVPTKPFINSYGNFLHYIQKYNILLTPSIRRYALELYMNRHKLK